MHHSLICLLLLLTVAAHAQSDTVRYEFRHPQMGTVFRLVFYSTPDSLAAQAVAERVFAHVDSLNSIFSDYQPESELSRLSDRAGQPEPVPVSDELWRILQLSNGFSQQSDGAFDVTVGALTRLWRRARNLKELPDSVRITAAKASVDYRNLHLQEGRKVVLKTPGTRLDLGGIAQGYAADQCLEMLQHAGIRRALADAGGDIALGDPPPNERGWRIEKPGKKKTETLWLSNCGITTSGATYRFLEVNGVRYSHIVDPRTGWALTHRNLVTVQAPNAVTADAYATAVSVGGKNLAKHLRKSSGVKIWVTREILGE